MDPDMIRPRKCKPCPPPPPPSSPKREAPPPPPHSDQNVAQACQHDCCNSRGHPFPFSPLAPPPPPPPPPSLSQFHPPSHIRNYWNDDLDQFSRMRRVESLEMGYRMNFRDPFDDFPVDHTPRRCMALQPPLAVPRHQRHGPPPMLMGDHHGQPPLKLGHYRGQPPLLLGHHREPPASYFPPPGDYGYQHGYSGYENPNGCTIM
ncbi:hypothetical protein RND71_006851 [Anisodus tanguticus]|uniref:Uncharacterized protein n=1 Tax=Anisodus tanguticus TaxID=243964 RepID=A0AAE1SUN0_9SOLA|nr:hypothetical protein RND71_006851 [Anisodus tanguticus]